MKLFTSSRYSGGGFLYRLIPSLLMVLTSSSLVSAQRKLMSTSLNTCMENSGITATKFNVTFSPDDYQLYIDIQGDSTIMGNVKLRLTVIAYGFTALETELDPCHQQELKGMCPIAQTELKYNFQEQIPKDSVNRIPAIAYNIPDLDGIARMEVIDSSGQKVACVEAPLSNGKTVDQPAVGWITAAIAGLALVSSAIVSGMGHSSTAAHVAANALSLFSYFQAQVMIGMIAVPLPPLAASWCQNYDWALGIINIDFMQRIFHWYIQATGGIPANLFIKQGRVSVQVAKRSLSDNFLRSRAAHYGYSAVSVVKRALNIRSNNNSISSNTVISVTGIERLAYKAKIEKSNLFMTGLSFFIAFMVLVALFVTIFKYIVELSAKKMRAGSFRDFRNKWLAVLKGIMYRVILIGFPQMAILCPWEWTHKDSPAAVSLAVFFFFVTLGVLGWACFKVMMLAKHSSHMDKSLGPSYVLYSDPAALNRWGYLYVQFRQNAFYFIIPVLVYTLAKGLTIAFGQNNGNVQTIVLVIIELAYLSAVSYMRPWLDKRTNIVNIAIAVVNFVNSVIVFLFSGVTKAPRQVPGVLGVVFFILNAVFALILLVLVSVSVCMALFSKNPDSKFVTLPLGSPTTNSEKGGLHRSASNIRDLDDDDTVPNRLTAPMASALRASSPSRHSMQSENGVSTRSQEPYHYPLPPSTAGSDAARTQQGSFRTHSPQPMNWKVGAGYDSRV